MTRMTGPDCEIMCNLIHSHTHTHQSRVLTRGFRQSMVVDAGETGVLLHLFFANVSSKVGQFLKGSAPSSYRRILKRLF